MYIYFQKYILNLKIHKKYIELNIFNIIFLQIKRPMRKTALLLFFNILPLLFNGGHSAIADIEEVLDNLDNPKNYRTIFKFPRGTTARAMADIDTIYFGLEKELLKDRNTAGPLKDRAEIAIKELRDAYLGLTGANAISDLAFAKTNKITSILSRRETERNARVAFQFSRDYAYADLEFSYKRWRQFFLADDIKSAVRDDQRAYAVLNRLFALLIPAVSDHQAKGSEEVQRIGAAPNSQEILFDPAQPLDPGAGGLLLEMEKNFVRLKALVDPATYTPALSATTTPTLDEAQDANKNLDEAYAQLLVQQIKQRKVQQQNDPSKLPRVIFGIFFLKKQDPNVYTVAEMTNGYNEMMALIASKADDQAKLVLREALFRGKLDASDYFDSSVNQPALGQFKNVLSNSIDQIFAILGLDLANDYAKMLDYQPNDDLEAKFQAKEAEFRKIRKEIRGFTELKDSRELVEAVNDCLDAIENAHDELLAQLPPSNPGSGTTGGGGGGTGTGGGSGGGGGSATGTGGGTSGGSGTGSGGGGAGGGSSPSNPPAAPSPTGAGGGSSLPQDKAKNCQQMKSLCSNPLYEGILKIQCAKTCANAGIVCADSRPSCGNWRRNGFCISKFYTDAIKNEYCRLTCGLC